MGGAAAGTVASAGVAAAAVVISVPCSPAARGGGPAGLIAAINSANARGGGTIDLAAGCTYSLGPKADNDSDGLPLVRTAITLNGNSSTVARSQAAGTALFRIFEVHSPGNLTLNSVTVSGGRASNGGGIRNTDGGTVTLNNARVGFNAATLAGAGNKASGGGIFNDEGGTISLNNSRVDHNVVTGTAGAFAVGGGLYDNHGGTLRLNASRVDHNSVTAPKVTQGGGIGVDFMGAPRTVMLNSSQVDGNLVASTDSGNDVVAKGGGIGTNGTTLMLSSSRVVSNSVSAPGGAAFGGGIHSLTAKGTGVPDPDGLLSLTGSQVNSNTASGNSAEGGAITNQSGTAKVASSQANGNTASATGGAAARGGGIENHRPDPSLPSPPLSMTASQLSDNTVSASAAPACGGGLFNSGRATVSFSTVTANRASGFPAHGGGLFNAHTVSLVSSLVAGNVPGNRVDGTIASCTS
jgi:hypothetical protein